LNSKPTQGQNEGYQQSTADQAQTNNLTNQVNQNNSQFNGPVQNTPYYKALLQQGTTSTNQAYDSASRNLKTSMEGAGVGGSSGAAAGNNAAMASQRASTLSQVQPSATTNATNMQMNANQQSLQEAGMYSGAGLGYFGGANQDEQNALQRQSSMYAGLLQAGMGAASPFLGNLAKTGSWTGS
jgi:hypothetical protein